MGTKIRILKSLPPDTVINGVPARQAIPELEGRIKDYEGYSNEVNEAILGAEPPVIDQKSLDAFHSEIATLLKREDLVGSELEQIVNAILTRADFEVRKRSLPPDFGQVVLAGLSALDEKQADVVAERFANESLRRQDEEAARDWAEDIKDPVLRQEVESRIQAKFGGGR